MSSESDDPRSALLNQVIADYLATAESGNGPDREELLRQYPDLADDLRSFLADHDRTKSAREGIEAPTLPPNQMALEAVTIPPGDPTEGGADNMTLPPGPADVDATSKLTTQVGNRVRYFGDYDLLEEIARGGMGGR